MEGTGVKGGVQVLLEFAESCRSIFALLSSAG